MKLLIDRIKIRSSGFGREQVQTLVSELGQDILQQMHHQKDNFSTKGRRVIPSITLKTVGRNKYENESEFRQRLAGRIVSGVKDQKSDISGKDK